MAKRAEKGAYPDVDFSCDRCATCCGDVPGHKRNILMLPGEAARISAGAGKDVSEFASRARAGPYKFRMKKTGTGRCIFLGKANLCTIYSGRPLICRAFPFELRTDGSWGVSSACCGVGKGKRVPAKFFRGLEKLASEAFEALSVPDRHGERV